MSLNPWIDYLKIPELNQFLQKEGYDLNERITPRAICNHPAFTRMGFIILHSGEFLTHPQNFVADLSQVREYWLTHGSEVIVKDLNDWNQQLRGRTAIFQNQELVHLYTSSSNKDLVNVSIQLLTQKGIIGREAVVLDEYGIVLGKALDLQ